MITKIVFLTLILLGRVVAVQAAERVVIRYLGGPGQGDFANGIIADFERIHPGIRVMRLDGPESTDRRRDDYRTSFKSQGAGYDLVYMDVSWLPEFAANGWLRPLDDLFPTAEQRAYLSGDLEGSRYQGKIYRLPLHSDGGLLYYRKDLLAGGKAAPPRTWDELVTKAAAIQAPPAVWGFVFQGKAYEGLTCVFLEMLWGNGGDVLGEKGAVLVDRPEAVEALQRLVDAVHLHRILPPEVLTFQEDESLRFFREGRAVFMRNWPYAWKLLEAPDSPVRGKVGILPMVRGKGRNVGALGGWGFAVSAASKHPKEAWEFAKFFASERSQKIALFEAGLLPTRKSLFSDAEVLKRYPQMKDLYPVLRGTRSRPVTPYYAKVSEALQNHVSSALSGRDSPAAALAKAAVEIRGIVRP